MSDLPAQLFQRLGDGEFHSGVALAGELAVTRSAVWKAVGALRALGAEIHSVPHRGYRLRSGHAGGAALDGMRILAAVPPPARARIELLDVAWSLPSTNAALLERAPPRPDAALVQLAEHQTAGRGRRGRSWVAPLGGSICLSLGWTFGELPREISALSLAVGVAVRRVLAALGARDVRLKWPNDLIARDGKLGGILIELRAEAAGPGYVVIGIGLNVALGTASQAEVAAAGAAAVDLAELDVVHVDRNVLAANLVAELLATVRRFTDHGFAPFAAEWAAADALRDRPVVVRSGAEVTEGIARGIDATGALLVETHGGTERYVSGEVTVRAQS